VSRGFLLPSDVRDWLGADHLAWFVIDAVEQMDLSAFYAVYRADGHGRAGYEPSLMQVGADVAVKTGGCFPRTASSGDHGHGPSVEIGCTGEREQRRPGEG